MFSKKTVKYLLAIAVAAALPLSSFFILRSISDGRIHMPAHYRVDRVDSSRDADGKVVYDTVFHRVKELTLTNQLGKEVSLNKDLKGKILVVDFIFTSCRSVCPRLTDRMRLIQKSYIKKNPDWVQFISISVDPEHDSVEALRAYADRYQADHDRWWFLTGDRDKIFDYARNELGLSLQPSDGNPGMLDHSEKFVLIDTARYIRGYFNGLDIVDDRKIADDISILTMEKIKKKKQ